MESAGLRGSFHEAYLPEFGVGSCFEGYELGLGRISPRDNGLSDVDTAGLMFTEAVEGLIDQPGFGWVTMDEGEVAFLNFPTLLHFPEEGGVVFTPCHQEKAAGFAIESANKRKKLIGILVTKPVDQGKGAVGTRRVNKPTGRFVDDQKRRMFQDNRRIHEKTLVQIHVSVEV